MEKKLSIINLCKNIIMLLIWVALIIIFNEKEKAFSGLKLFYIITVLFCFSLYAFDFIIYCIKSLLKYKVKLKATELHWCLLIIEFFLIGSIFLFSDEVKPYILNIIVMPVILLSSVMTSFIDVIKSVKKENMKTTKLLQPSIDIE